MKQLARTIGCIFVAALAAGSAGASNEDVAEEIWRICVDGIEADFEARHLDLASIDQKGICTKAVEKARSGLPMHLVWDWVQLQTNKAIYHWAPPGARHWHHVRYRYPYVAWIPRLLTQAEGGGTHNGKAHHYAFDFFMPTGKRVLAARKGQVVEVSDGTPEGVPWERDFGNSVTILHEDGTFAVYAHLRADVPVKVGKRVRAGRQIGWSGHTGVSAAPHLHLIVQRIDEIGEVEALPIRFGRRGTPGVALKAGHHWGVMPRSKRTLRISVDGQQASADARGSKADPFSVQSGHTARLKVELVGADGAVRDVTVDEATRYESMTVWTLHSLERGRMRVAPIPGITPEYIASDVPPENAREGLLFVYHGKPADSEFGLAQVHFDVAPAEAP